ncbi:ATP-binding cassette domain-containing protein [Atopobacter sp. AH10]|uniref:energy-coupling factor ABC transporter ATP-binding protein n=1 Tax=Atopobacter sp. AH10 TaxID=2315861 RepID=UPI000EF1A042|nr:ATP-binding cassette domain-containing protein [Atopobacter sp. AH10]RLK63446.1 ATP-binding cassette domain-containing protein [Atopobacter sp. AH10]
MSVLKLDGVTYRYPNQHLALENVTVSFEAGQAVAIIGQNGAGKTTTAKLMNGLLRPTCGHVLVNGKKTTGLTTAQMAKYVGYVFQNPDDQIFQETIEKEIAFGPAQKGKSKEEVEKIVKEVAEVCGLSDSLGEHPYNISYSKRKFISIAAVLATDPAVVVLDEPTAGQDRESLLLLGRIIRYMTEKGKAVLTITHDMEFVVREFQRVLVFANRRLQRDGQVGEIFADKDLLFKSGLKQPYICQFADQLGFKGVLTMEDLAQAIQSRGR